MEEYSFRFRFFAYLAVSVAIIAVAWAIRDPLLVVVGILGLAAGHIYSWRRRNFSIVRSLILLLFMGLTVFLGGDILLSGLSDRLLLSRYLIFGLVIGSFDLMLRRNVLASLILGGLLLILVSEFALSWWFLLFPLLFTFLALSAIIVSRVDAARSQSQLVGDFNWLKLGKFWLGFGVAVFTVAAVFFLLMPRIASSQVTQATWLPSRLDLSLGGFPFLPSRPSGLATEGIFPSQDSLGGGYATLGYTGSSADQPVMYVRSRISSYWRGLTLDEYDGRGWLSSTPEVRQLSGSRGQYLLPDSRRASGEDKVYWQIYYLLADQPNAIFTGYSPGRIYLPETFQAFLEKGTLYRAYSLVPNLRPERLRLDRVAPDDVENLALPPITERVAALAESIVRGASTDYDKAARLERFLATNYPYDLNVGGLPPDRDAVDYFLFEQQAGYCAHFATAMAVMARHVGLPARVAAGYLPGVIDTMSGAHTVRAGDAHAWVEIHFQRHGWVAFDPTPRADAAVGFGSGRNWVYFGLQNLTGVSFTGVMSSLKGNLSLGSLSVPRWTWVLVPGVVILIIMVVRLLGRRKKHEGARTEYSRLDGEARLAVLRQYRKMVKLLGKKGVPARPAYQPLAEYAALAQGRLPVGRELVDWLTDAANRAAYDPAPFPPAMTQEARGKLQELKRVVSPVA